VTGPDDVAGLVAEAEALLRGQAVARRLAELIQAEVIEPARELFGDRATPWSASTLRTTADVLERLDLG
jgi:hypothetical protein